jgi:hypothetical protein
MNHNSFANLEYYERMPLRKWRLLLEIHNECVDEQNAAMNAK